MFAALVDGYQKVEGAGLPGFYLLLLLIVGGLNTAISLFYYLRVVKVMFFDEPVDTRAIDARGDVRVLLSANGAAILLLGILPGGLMVLCVRAIVQALTT